MGERGAAGGGEEGGEVGDVEAVGAWAKEGHNGHFEEEIYLVGRSWSSADQAVRTNLDSNYALAVLEMPRAGTQ